MPSSKRKKHIYLFVDGSNFYAGQYELFGPQKYLDFAKFIKQVEKTLKINFTKIYFYASYSPKSKKPKLKEKLYLKNEALFYKSTKKLPNLTFFKGYRSPTSGKEKEVDVKLAVDIVNMAWLNRYSELYLLSGDADFMHALNIVREKNKKAHILACENRIPNRLAYFYQTHLFVFTNKLKRNLSKKQKIKIHKISVTNLLGTIKNPGVHARRAS